MNQGFYIQFKREELIIRDYLAADRTVLANERTFMAFIRTSIALAAAGGSLIHFLDLPLATIGGILLLALAAVTLGWGLRRFFFYKRHLENLQLTNWHEHIQWIRPGEGI